MKGGLCALVLLALPAFSAADGPYPAHPVERALGQPVVILNRPGAGGTVGTVAAIHAAGDGYTLLMALASISTNPEQDRIAERATAFELADLIPLARVSVEPMLLAVRAESPYRTLRDLIDDAKRRPGVISYTSSGVYGVYHVATEMFAHAGGLQFNHIPYNGGAPALLALVSGDIDFGLVTRSVGLKQLQAGKLRPLAAWGERRWEEFPDVRTVRELGLEGGDYTMRSGLFVRAGTPAPITGKLREAVPATMDAARLAEVIRRMGKLE